MSKFKDVVDTEFKELFINNYRKFHGLSMYRRRSGHLTFRRYLKGFRRGHRITGRAKRKMLQNMYRGIA